MNASLWSLLGMSVEYALGVERRFNIFGSDGRAGYAFANFEEADTSFVISALGDTM